MPAAGTLGPAVAEFFEGCLLITEGDKKGEPFVLDQWQRDALDLIYETDEDGRRCWREVLLGIPRGNGKSPITAGLALFEMMNGTGTPTVHCCAASKEQAGVVYGFAYDMVQRGALDDYIATPRSKRGMGPMTCDQNDGILKALSADGLLQHGRNPSVIIVDELHAFTTGKQQELYTSQTSTLHKRDDSVMFVITTAGPNKDSLLGELYDAKLTTHELEYRDNGCLIIGRDHEGKSLLIWYGAPEDADVSDPAVWRACSPATWISDEGLRLAAHREPESVFRRLYLNQWVVGENAAIQPATWDACEKKGGIPPGSPVWVGVDLGERRDHTGIVIVAPRPNGKLRVKSMVFDPQEENVKSLLPIVERELRRIAETYEIRAVGYDRWQMPDLANRLSSAGLWMVEVPQNDTHMVPASGALWDLIQQGQLVHDGDKTLRKHMLHATADLTTRGGWRFGKPKTKGGAVNQKAKIDACIALTIATKVWSDDAAVSAPWTAEGPA